MFYSQLLTQNKQERDLLFLWSDRCFLLLLNREAGRLRVRDEAIAMLGHGYRADEQIGGRPALLHIGANLKLWQVSEFASASNFGEALDRHLASVAG